MSRNLKALGLALVAVLAMNALTAAGASAEAFKFKAEKTPTTLVGKQHGAPDIFTVDTQSVSCNEATYTGTVTGTEVTELTVTPTYSECIAFGLFNIPIDTNGCQYKSTVDTKVGASFEGKVDIVCPAGQVIKITAPGCTVTVGSQNGLGSITYTNVGSGATREITMDVNINKGIAYEEHRPLFGICANNTVPKTNGSYIGAGLVTGKNSAIHSGVFVG